jgi:hypothetical protein
MSTSPCQEVSVVYSPFQETKLPSYDSSHAISCPSIHPSWVSTQLILGEELMLDIFGVGISKEGLGKRHMNFSQTHSRDSHSTLLIVAVYGTAQKVGGTVFLCLHIRFAHLIRQYIIGGW